MSAAPILTILKEGEIFKEVSLEGEVSVGRGEGNVIRLSDRSVSRSHALLRATQNGVQIEKKSHFGAVFVNGAECTHALLKEGDVVSIGPYLLKYKAEVVEKISVPELIPELKPEVSIEASATSLEAPVDSLGTQEVAESAVSDFASVGSAEVIEGSGNTDALADGNIPQDALDFGDSAGDFNSVPDSGVSELIGEDEKTGNLDLSNLNIRLVFEKGAANQIEFEIKDKEIAIGRGKNCTVVLNDKKSSRRHATVRRAGLHFILKDLESANGVYVNGEKITECELSGNDVIRIGDTEFQFKALDAAYESKQGEFLKVEEIAEPDLLSLPTTDFADAFANPEHSENNGVFQQQPGLGNTGVHGISGISGIESDPGKKQSLYVKYIKNFKELPTKQKVIIVALVLGLGFVLLGDDEDPKKAMNEKSKKIAAKPSARPSGGVASFETLSADEKKYVESQYALSIASFKGKDYDKTLFEIKKIFQLIPDYQDSRMIERYAQEGKKKLEALEDENRRKQDEERLKQKIVDLVQDAKLKMEQKKYPEAKAAFSEILALDPDNTQVSSWQKEINAIDEAKKSEEQQKSIREEISQRAWQAFNDADALRKAGKCHSAIPEFAKVAEIGAPDPAPAVKAKAMIQACKNSINKKREPYLTEGMQLEKSGEFQKAFAQYKQATMVDPPHPAGYAGMQRCRSVLSDRAKGLYSEALFAESFSDFSGARKKFQQILDTTPKDDLYYQRADRKLSRYKKLLDIVNGAGNGN